MSTGPQRSDDPTPEDPRPDDEALLAELAALLRPALTPPPEVVEAAHDAYSWRSLGAELAALSYDSLLDAAPSGTRAAAQPRILTFSAAGLTIEAEIDATPTGRRLLGQLVPPGAAELELRTTGDGPITGRADELGRFVLPLPVRRQQMSLRCTTPGGVVVETAWAAV
jgi:hypothetical protein